MFNSSCQAAVRIQFTSVGFVYVMKRALHAHVGSKITFMAKTMCHSFTALNHEILFLPLKHKIHIFSLPCNILYILFICILYISFTHQRSNNYITSFSVPVLGRCNNIVMNLINTPMQASASYG